MAITTYWADSYVEKKRTGPEAIRLIKPGQRVFIGSSCGEPQYLVKELFAVLHIFTDLEIIRLFRLESTPLTLTADKTADQKWQPFCHPGRPMTLRENRSKEQTLNIRSFYLGSARPEEIAKDIRFITPINLSAVPRLFKSRKLPIHVALIQVSPSDDFGWMSLGVSVDVTLAAALSADLVIAQVNSRMPRVLGRSFIHVNDVDVIVEHEEQILTIREVQETEFSGDIGRHVARLVDDGSTIQIGLGAAPHAILLALSDKNDLGIHTQYLTNDIMDLVSKGVVTNRKKGFNEGKLVASSAIGTETLYDFMDDNPGIEFHPSDYVNDPGIISRHNRMVSLNVAMAMDLTGQVAADAFSCNHFTGVTGMLDFIRGATQAEGGKSILMLPSTDGQGKESRIVPFMKDTAIIVPRGDVHYVVTEYGVVNLFGKSMQERALSMISIAHPDFRNALFDEAKNMGLISAERTSTKSIGSIYPLKLEETVAINGDLITFRPAKPVDERRIQEHFYTMDKRDILSRFFQEKDSFVRAEAEDMSLIDYIKELTIVAVMGEPGFEKVVGVGEYLLDQKKNMAEVAFSVSKEWQGRGLGKILLRKLSEAA
ncbi:MAG: GNAT family N-acetyltransferase, partial [Deltaproteobacteria bacterium]|nr:GNAT family N-acetyltransferase [Deltaproteobacteria bacterium]